MALADLNFDVDTTEERSVPCDGCTLCCWRQIVPVAAELGDDPASYVTREIYGVTALEEKPDGSCFYLGPTGCTIYHRRPAVCRSYTCVGQYLTLARAERRRRIKARMLDPAVMDRAHELIEKHGFTLADVRANRV